jgi:fibronectin type 3 domain-containing protein
MTQVERTNLPPAACKQGTLHSVRLSWNASATLLNSPNGGNYKVYRWEQEGEACGPVKVEPTKTTYEDCDVKAGHTYRYTVTAVKPGYNESDPTNVVEASIK